MKITTAELWDEVVKVAAENPDYIYEHDVCRYEMRGKPACIVGQAMYRLGASVDDLAQFDNHGAIGGVVRDCVDVFSSFDNVSLDALSRAQGYQDQREPWGVAVESAKDAMG